MAGIVDNNDSSGSLNNIVERGVYYVSISGGKNTDMPDDVYWGILTVTQTSWGQYRTISQYLQSNDNRHYTRSSYSATSVYPTECTTPWQRIDNFGCNTLEELAAALKPKLGLS